MSENNTRRSVLKKIAAASVVGSSLAASTGTAAAADAKYEIEVGLKANNDGFGEYRLFIPYGDDDYNSISGDGDTEPEDGLYDDTTRGGFEVSGSLDSSADDLTDTWIIDSMDTNYQVDYKDDDVYVSDTL